MQNRTDATIPEGATRESLWEEVLELRAKNSDLEQRIGTNNKLSISAEKSYEKKIAGMESKMKSMEDMLRILNQPTTPEPYPSSSPNYSSFKK